MIPDTMQALVLHGIADLRLERVPVPAIRAGEVLVRVAAAGVCGSDIPRVYEHGAYHHPLIPGHEFSGVVAQVSDDTRHRVRERVTVKPLIPCRRCPYCETGALAQCVSYDYLGSRSDGAWAEYVRVPEANLVPLPEGLSIVAAALSEPAAVALHAMRQGHVAAGDTVAILGTGPIGMILAQWARVVGAGQVLLLDIDEEKLRLAGDLALGRTHNSREGDPVEWILGQTGGLGADVVIEAAGVAATVNQALRAARPLGNVVLMGNPASDVVLPQRTVSQVLRKELSVRGTWNSRFTRLPVDEWGVVVEMMATGRIRVEPLISHRVPLEQALSALEMMRNRTEPYSRVVLTMGGDDLL